MAAAESSMGSAGWPPRTALLPSNIQSGIPISGRAVRAPLQSRTADPIRLDLDVSVGASDRAALLE